MGRPQSSSPRAETTSTPSKIIARLQAYHPPMKNDPIYFLHWKNAAHAPSVLSYQHHGSHTDVSVNTLQQHPPGQTIRQHEAGTHLEPSEKSVSDSHMSHSISWASGEHALPPQSDANSWRLDRDKTKCALPLDDPLISLVSSVSKPAQTITPPGVIVNSNSTSGAKERKNMLKLRRILNQTGTRWQKSILRL